jgi:hypothetical protein
MRMSDNWLPTLQVSTPDEGWNLAVKMSRVGVKATQPSDEIRKQLRGVYAENADSLIASSHVIALNFQTVAAANNYWRA